MSGYVKQCRVCDSEDLELVIDLGNHPWCNQFVYREELEKLPVYPLQVCYCRQCKAAQLNYTVSKEIMFGNHTYRSGITETLRRHFDEVAHEVNRLYKNSSEIRSVLDIGSNDGTQLACYKKLGWDVLGVESSKPTAQYANEQGIPTLAEFFNLECSKKINRQFDIINAAGVFFHLEELHSVSEGIRFSLKKDGNFIIQFLYMPSIIHNVAFDQIYHEHLLYYSLKSVNALLQRHGMMLYDCWLSPIHGGSIIGYACHQGEKDRTERCESMFAREEAGGYNTAESYKNFMQTIERQKLRDLNFIKKCVSQNKRIFGMGAPVKGNTLLNFYGITSKEICYLVERNPYRRGLYAPGSGIPVVIEDEFEEIPDVYFVLAWNFKKEIMQRYDHLIKQGVEFYFPVDPS